MKIAINREHCVNGLQKASNITPAKAGAAMLRTMWIRTDREKKSISLMATDASTEYIGTYPAEVEEDGLVGVQAKSVTDLLRALPGHCEHGHGRGRPQSGHQPGKQAL